MPKLTQNLMLEIVHKAYCDACYVVLDDEKLYHIDEVCFEPDTDIGKFLAEHAVYLAWENRLFDAHPDKATVEYDKGLDLYVVRAEIGYGSMLLRLRFRGLVLL